MLRNLFSISHRFASSDSPRKVVICANGTIAAWHPPQEFPYEHTKPIDLSEFVNKDQSSRLSASAKASAIPREPISAELKEIFYTSKHEWYSRNFILALEHKPVYTVGIRNKRYTIEEEERLKLLGAEFHKTSRGGLITFHGPGQLVLYPICDVRRVSTKQLSIRSFVDKLEQTIIDAAGEGFGIKNVGRTKNTGVWVSDTRKLAAIGIAVSGGVSYHGIAINCNTDLAWFDNIIGCGIEGVSTTSLSRELCRDVPVSEALPVLLSSFAKNFECILDHSADDYCFSLSKMPSVSSL